MNEHGTDVHSCVVVVVVVVVVVAVVGVAAVAVEIRNRARPCVGLARRFRSSQQRGVTFFLPNPSYTAAVANIVLTSTCSTAVSKA